MKKIATTIIWKRRFFGRPTLQHCEVKVHAPNWYSLYVVQWYKVAWVPIDTVGCMELPPKHEHPK